MSTVTYVRSSVGDQISAARSAIERATNDAGLGRQLSNNPEQFLQTEAVGDINIRAAGSTIKFSEIILYVPLESRIVVAQALISRLIEFNDTESQIEMTAKPAFPVADVWLAAEAAVAVVDVAVVVEFAVADRKDAYKTPKECLQQITLANQYKHSDTANKLSDCGYSINRQGALILGLLTRRIPGVDRIDLRPEGFTCIAQHAGTHFRLNFTSKDDHFVVTDATLLL